MAQHGMAFTARATGDGDALRIVVTGELDLVTVAELEREIGRVAEVATARVLIDISELTFCDLTGQRALVAIAAAGADLCGTPARCVRSLFEFAGHADLLPDAAAAGAV